MKALICVAAALVAVCLAAQTAFSNDGIFQLSVQSGPFAPSDWMVQGYEKVTYYGATDYREADADGFGAGAEIIICGRYSEKDWAVLLDTGVRLHTNRKYAINTYGGWQRFENKLTVFPVCLSVIHEIGAGDSAFKPYLGLGPGIYFSSWETKRFYEYAPLYREWYKGSDTSFGAHFLVGLDYRLYRNFDLKMQYRYSFILSKWELENQDSGTTVNLYDLNIGGTSLRFGIGFNF